MSTHWTAGVLQEDGTVIACYVNFNGARRDAYRAMRAFAQSAPFDALLDEIRRGQVEGGIRQIDGSTGDVETYSDFRGEMSRGAEWVHNSPQHWQRTCLLVQESDGSVIDGHSL